MSKSIEDQYWKWFESAPGNWGYHYMYANERYYLTIREFF